MADTDLSPFYRNMFGQTAIDIPEGRLRTTEARLAALETIVPHGAWTNYTPVITSSGGTDPVFTYTNGTPTGAYTQIGRTVYGWLRFVINTVSTVGTGLYRFSLPVPASVRDLSQNPVMGSGWIYDNSVATLKNVSALQLTGSHLQLFVEAVSNYQVTSTTPWTWGVGDQIDVFFTYEATASAATMPLPVPTGFWAPAGGFPASPALGDQIYRSDLKVTFAWNGTQWDPIGGLKPYIVNNNSSVGSTASAVYVDTPTAVQVSFTKYATHTGLWVQGVVSNYVTGSGGLVTIGMRINSVDYDVGHFYFNNLSVHTAYGFTVSVAAGLAPGTYTAKIRWKMGGGVTGNMDTNDFVRFSVQEVLP